MNSFFWKFSFLFFFFGLSLSLAPSAKAQLTEDAKVDVVQSHFHFKNSTTNQDLSHNALKMLLRQWNGGGTYLDQGVFLATEMDTKQKFGLNNYRDATSDIANEAISALGYPDIITGSLDALNLIFLDTNIYIDGLVAAYDTFSQIYDTWALIDDAVNNFQTSLINGLVRDYIATVADPDNDAEQWADLSLVYGALISNTNFDLHSFCKGEFRLNEQFNTILPGQIDQYKADVNASIAGSVHINYTPEVYALYAPVQVIMDASGSTGTFGNTNITSYQWTVDNTQVSTASIYTGSYFAVGPHNIQCTVTDSTGAQITSKNTINVGPPPIQVTNLDTNHLQATFNTPANSLVNNPNGCIWDFGDGSTPVVSNINAAVNHTFPSNQAYTVTLTEATFVNTNVTGTTKVNFAPSTTPISGGTLTNSTEWDSDGNPYIIQSSIIVPAGIRLTLGPGVVLQFAQGAGLYVYGQLVSNGQDTPLKRVYLTSYRDNSPPSLPVQGIDAGQPGDWVGLQFFPGSSGTLTSCVIREASTGVSGDIPIVAGATFDRCGIDSNSSIPLTISGCTFSQTSVNLTGKSQRDVTLSGNVFTNGSGASFTGSFGTLAFSGNSSGDGDPPVGFILSNVALSRDNIWGLQNGIHLISYGGLVVRAGATLTLGAGMVLQFNSNTDNLIIQGDLHGTGSPPAILTADADASPYGGQDSNANWSGLQYDAGLTANLSGIIVRHANIGVQGLVASVTGGTFDRCGNFDLYHSYDGTTLRTTDLSLSGNTFLSMNFGLNAGNASPTVPFAVAVTNNAFYSSTLSISGPNTPDVTVSGNTFYGGGNVYFSGNFGLLALNGNTTGDNNTVGFSLSNISLSRNNTWGLQNGIHLSSNSGLVVRAGATLTLGAGMVLQFNSNTDNLIIHGDLHGTGGPSAILTCLSDNSPYGGQDGNANSNANWGGLQYDAGLTANLSGVIVRHANIGVQGLVASVTGGTFDRCGNFDLYHSYDGTTLRTTDLSLSGNTFLSMNFGLNAGNASPTVPFAVAVTNNAFYSSTLSISGPNTPDVTVSGNTFYGGGNVYFSGNFGLLALSGNTTGDNNTVGFSLSNVTLTKTSSWNAETGIHLVNGGPSLTVAHGATLNLGAGLVLQTSNANTGNYNIVILGDLRGPTSGNPAVITGDSDNSPYGGQDGYDGWAGITFGAGLTASLQDITIKHASAGLTADTANLNNCTFTENNTGVLINNGGGVYRNCSFTQNSIAVQNNSTLDVDARGNWWGDSTGPYNAKNNPTGQGNPVSDHVIVGNLVTSSSTGQTHILWNNTNGIASIWNYDPNSGNYSQYAFGPYAGWSAKTIADGGTDGKTRLLWNNTNGTAALWNLDTTNGNFTANSYGPYAGWTANAVSVASDNTTHILWNNTNGEAALWNVHGGQYQEEHDFGPYAGWTAQALADGPDSQTRLLWTNTNGQAALWNISPTTGAFSQFTFGPYSGWTAKAISAGATTTHVLWTNSNGTVAVWNYSPATGTFTQKIYGPYSGWVANGLADGSDGKVHLLWDNVSGQASFWSVDNATGVFSQFSFGPYSGWTATAITGGN